MGKQILNFSAICDDILSPGKIIWQKSSGNEVIISAKYSFLNLSMIEKLQNGGQNIFIEDADESELHAEIVESFLRMKGPYHIKDKIVHRNRIINLLKSNYIDTPRSQDDLNQLGWKLFSSVSRDEATEFLNRDINLFKRGMSVASTVVFSAFLMGHYDFKFLNDLFTSTFKNLMNVGSELQVYWLKEKLESLRAKTQFDEEDKTFLKSINGSEVITSEQDLNNLELIASSLNAFYLWDKEYEGENLLKELYAGKLRLNPKIVDLIKENLAVATKEKVAA